jgi:hypothetical protein
VEHLCRRYDLEQGAFPPLPGEASSPGWTLWASVDAGVRDPYCVLWFARDPSRRRVFVWDEQYGTGITPLRQAQRLKARLASVGGRWLEWREERVNGGAVRRRVQAPAGARLHLDSVRVDPAMFTPRANVGVSDAAVYAGVGVPVQKAFNERVMGWRRVLEWLEPQDDGLPGLVLVEGACPNLQRTLPRLTADPDDPEDVEEGQEDHAADALRYGLNPASAPTQTREGLTLHATMGDERAGGRGEDDLDTRAYAGGAFGAPGGPESRW